MLSVFQAWFAVGSVFGSLLALLTLDKGWRLLVGLVSVNLVDPLALTVLQGRNSLFFGACRESFASRIGEIHGEKEGSSTARIHSGLFRENGEVAQSVAGS